MFDYKTLFVFISSIVGIIGYSFYFLDVFKGKTKPHLFTWLIWGILTGIALLAQLAEGAGQGAWMTVITVVVCFTLSIIALINGTKNISKIDWICFTGAIISIIVWQLTDSPMLAVITVTLSDTLGFIPTFRKGYYTPQEETPIGFLLQGVGFGLSLLALDSFNFTTALYPLYIFLADTACASMIYYRMKVLSKIKVL